MYWFLDFESYKIGGEEYVVKEMSILASDGTQCYSYMVKPPKHFYAPENYMTFIYQYTRHRLPWNFGDYTFKEVIEDIGKKVGIQNVYVKGAEKSRFLKKHLFNLHELELLSSLNTMNKCIGDCCEVKHGRHCARRKVCELRAYVNNNNVLLS